MLTAEATPTAETSEDCRRRPELNPSSVWGGPRAGVRRGGRLGRSRQMRMERTGVGSVTKAMILMDPPHEGHTSGRTS